MRRWWRERHGAAPGVQGGLRDLRTGYAAVGALFHLTLWGLTSLGPFSPLMLALYPALFRPQDWPQADQGMPGPQMFGQVDAFGEAFDRGQDDRNPRAG